MFYVYVLKSVVKNIFYKGNTNNLERRLKQHFSGSCRSTKNLLPLKLIFVEICDTRIEARNLEKFLKSGYGREFIDIICK